MPICDTFRFTDIMIIIILREELLTISSEINCFVSHTPSKCQYSKKLVNFIGFCCVDVYSLKLLFQLQEFENSTGIQYSKSHYYHLDLLNPLCVIVEQPYLFM